MCTILLIGCGEDSDTRDVAAGATTSAGATGGAGGIAGSGGMGGTVTSSGGAESSSSTGGGEGGSGGTPSAIDECKAEACAGVPGCEACYSFCEMNCDAVVCGCSQAPGADYLIHCFEGASCDAIGSLTTLVRDSDLYACLVGVPAQEDCGLAAGSVETCWFCTYDQCGDALEACNADAACQPWLECITEQNCPRAGFQDNPQCYRECDANHPMAAALYQSVYACTCAHCDGCGVHQGGCDVVNR
jgi:hypothetical protein